MIPWLCFSLLPPEAAHTNTVSRKTEAAKLKPPPPEKSIRKDEGRGRRKKKYKGFFSTNKKELRELFVVDLAVKANYSLL